MEYITQRNFRINKIYPMCKVFYRVQPKQSERERERGRKRYYHMVF